MDTNLLKKKLLYRSNNRGSKENDLLLGKFVKSVVEDMKEEELLMLNNLLNESDVDIFYWINNKENLKTSNHHQIINRIKNFIERN
jgi:antitoxin CptB